MDRDLPRLRALAFATWLTGCGGGFVEPTPPVLSLVQVERTVEVRLEPVVFQPILDLQVPDDAEACSSAAARLQSILDASSEALLQSAVKLPTVNLAPGCSQSSTRTMSAETIRARMEEAIAEAPGFHVRPLILYANGSEVPLPRELLAEFGELVKPLSSGLRPLFWSVTSKSVAHQLVADRELEWTFATDDALMTSLTALAEAEFPLWSIPGQPGPEPLLPAPVLETAHALKVCAADRLAIEGVPADGTAGDVDPSRPPTARVLVPTLVAQPAGTPPPAPSRAVLEICAERCERFVPDGEGVGEAWRAMAGCALTGTTP